MASSSSTLLLALTLVVVSLTMMPKPHVAESPAEAYWKMKFGNETAMPKVVEDALLGSNENANNAFLQRMFHDGFPLSQKLDQIIQKDQSIWKYGNGTVTKKIDPTKFPIYLTETDLTRPGKTLNINFMKVEDDAKFLPKQVSNSIPFSSKKLAQILNRFNIKPGSISAEIMKNTLKACETQVISEENKICTLTLEHMVDHITTHVGKNVYTLSGYVEKDVKNVYTIVNAKKVESKATMVCHKTGYPYAVFYCHNLKNTDLYKVSTVDLEGTTTMEVIGVCHKDTSGWNPKHVSFQLLKVKEGSVPICHFIDERSVAFVLKQQ